MIQIYAAAYQQIRSFDSGAAGPGRALVRGASHVTRRHTSKTGEGRNPASPWSCNATYGRTVSEDGELQACDMLMARAAHGMQTKGYAQFGGAVMRRGRPPCDRGHRGSCQDCPFAESQPPRDFPLCTRTATRKPETRELFRPNGALKPMPAPSSSLVHSAPWSARER